MWTRRFVSVGLLLCAVLTAPAGCGQSDSDADDENAVVPEDPEPPVADAASPSVPPALAPVPLASAPPATPAERFPLIKNIEQTLRQPGPQDWAVSRSSLELSLSVTVEDARSTTGRIDRSLPAGARRMHVQFDRVRFAQEIPGQPRSEYDSSAAGALVPPAAWGYAGLKDNGFDFYLSHDNQIAEVVGFDQFVNRCVKNVAPERQAEMRALFGNPGGSEAVANFVDESIGILPASDLREGDVWNRERRFAQPVPMHARLRYTLRRLNSDSADIDVQGLLAPVGPALPGEGAREVSIALRGGRLLGSCTIDRRTGLPVYSRSQETLDMLVRTADGLEFEQSKSTVTTLRPAGALLATQPGTAAFESVR